MLLLLFVFICYLKLEECLLKLKFELYIFYFIGYCVSDSWNCKILLIFIFFLIVFSIWYLKIFMDFGFNIKSNIKVIKIFICLLLDICDGGR